MRDVFQSRLALVCYCAVGAFAGWMLRDDRPDEVVHKLNEARGLIWSAVDHQNGALQDHSAKRLDNAQLADVIEATTLPSLREAVRLTEEAAAVGAKGEVFDTLRAYAHARRDAAETFVEAIEANDASKLALAKDLTREAVRLGKSLGDMAKQAEDFKRPAVIHLGR